MTPVPIIIEEIAGMERRCEPVTLGVPIPKGMLPATAGLRLIDPAVGPVPVQCQPLAAWIDGSVKWLLLDFQVSIAENTKKELSLVVDNGAGVAVGMPAVTMQENSGAIIVDTGRAVFRVGRHLFRPFESVLVDGREILDAGRSGIALTDEQGIEFEPVIDTMAWETVGPLRSTLRVEGRFRSTWETGPVLFHGRLGFFADSAMVRLDLAVHNPRAAKHPGGLWDLGDPGSVFFKDLSLYCSLETDRETESRWSILEEPDDCADGFTFKARNMEKLPDPGGDLVVYQDSSGGRNWRSRNHVNRHNEVRNSFRGFRVFSGGRVIAEGLRANPILSVTDGARGIGAAVQHFWQNFPKAMEAEAGTITIRLFPKHYDDSFELQGGERKTHRLFIDFDCGGGRTPFLQWVFSPLVVRTTPRWAASSGGLPWLVPEELGMESEISGWLRGAVEGDNTFFHRREVIDEYGWRHFGELYADHESVGHEGTEPLVSHYNNQYDCIHGMLFRFTGTGGPRWFVLADQLCRHVRDIDIYHTDMDRPEFNRGLFWHTEHYIGAETATHRCFSRLHGDRRDLAGYGGGPSLSHNYGTGLLLHYYLTGEVASREALLELASFVRTNMEFEWTLCNAALKSARKLVESMKNSGNQRPLVQLNKVYGLDGPGRASGNALSTLLDAFGLTGERGYLESAEELIRRCIGPGDRIEKRDLHDIENRWMYTVFLQSLGKYLARKVDLGEFDAMWQYAGSSLFLYARWVRDHESFYLERPEKLEFPNETWAAQDMRKCNVLLYAALHGDSDEGDSFMERAACFYHGALSYLRCADTKVFTRPLALLMQNGMMYEGWRTGAFRLSQAAVGVENRKPKDRVFRTMGRFGAGWNRVLRLSPGKELRFFRWRILSKLQSLVS